MMRLLNTLVVCLSICSACSISEGGKESRNELEMPELQSPFFELKDTSTLTFTNYSQDTVVLRVWERNGERSVEFDSMLNYYKIDSLTLGLHTKSYFNYSESLYDTIPPKGSSRYKFDFSANTLFLRDYEEIVLTQLIVESLTPTTLKFMIPIEKPCQDGLYRQSYNGIEAENDTLHLTHKLVCNK